MAKRFAPIIACGIALWAGACGPSDVVSIRATEPPFPDEKSEPPYKSDFGDAPDELARTALSWHMPGNPLGRLAAQGDEKCILKKQRLFPFRGEQYALVAVWASRDEDCLGKNAVVLSLHSDKPGPHGRQVIEKTATSAGFGGTMIETQAAVEAELEALVGLVPVEAGKLPAWRVGRLQPDLVDALSFQPLTDPVTYEAVRASNATVLCWKTSETRLECTAEADRRRPAQIPLFAVYGSNEFRAMGHREATKLLLEGEGAGLAHSG